MEGRLAAVRVRHAAARVSGVHGERATDGGRVHADRGAVGVARRLVRGGQGAGAHAAAADVAARGDGELGAAHGRARGGERDERRDDADDAGADVVMRASERASERAQTKPRARVRARHRSSSLVTRLWRHRRRR